MLHSSSLLSHGTGQATAKTALDFKGKGMSEEEQKKTNSLTRFMTTASAGLLAFLTMWVMGVLYYTNDTEVRFAQSLLFCFLCAVFRVFTLRIFRWLYS